MIERWSWSSFKFVQIWMLLLTIWLLFWRIWPGKPIFQQQRAFNLLSEAKENVYETDCFFFFIAAGMEIFHVQSKSNNPGVNVIKKNLETICPSIGVIRNRWDVDRSLPIGSKVVGMDNYSLRTKPTLNWMHRSTSIVDRTPEKNTMLVNKISSRFCHCNLGISYFLPSVWWYIKMKH